MKNHQIYQVLFLSFFPVRKWKKNIFILLFIRSCLLVGLIWSLLYMCICLHKLACYRPVFVVSYKYTATYVNSTAFPLYLTLKQKYTWGKVLCKTYLNTNDTETSASLREFWQNLHTFVSASQRCGSFTNSGLWEIACQTRTKTNANMSWSVTCRILLPILKSEY